MRRPFLLLGVVLLIGAACGQGDQRARPSLSPELDALAVVDVHADDFQQYANAEELIAASDAVVGGTITKVAEGKFDTAPELEDFGGDQNVAITLTVDTVIVGSELASGDTVTIEWSGYEVDREGRPSRLYVENGVPFPTVGSVEVWFLENSEAHGWAVADVDDGRFTRSGDSLRALADTAGPAARDVEQLGVGDLVQLVAEGLDVDMVFRTGDTDLDTTHGSGWIVWASERGRAVGNLLASIVTSDRGLDRLWELGQFETPRPEITFERQVLIVLTPGVSGSCPDIAFEDLVIDDTEVFGAFRHPSETGICTGDFNPVTFFFIVERQALPEAFTLSVSREFNNCDGCSIEVDLSEEESVELELWGASTLALATAGTPPPDGAFNVVQWTADGEVGALLFTGGGWSEFPTWFQSFEPSFSVERIDGFVATCAEDQCEECEGEACAELPRLGEACSRSYQKTPYEDQTFVVTFDGTSCSIDVAAGVLGRDS